MDTSMKRSLLLLMIAACGAPATPAATTTPTNTTAAPAGNTVHDIDWLNFTYRAGIGEMEEQYTVVDGELEFAYDMEGNRVAPDYEPANPDEYIERGYFQVAAPEFGDLDGDGADEALIISVHNTGGTGQFDAITVYTMRDGGPAILGHIPGGDRGDGGISSASIADGAVVVERMMSQEGDGACCPSKAQHERWTFQGGAFVEDESARRLTDL
jgi:hypothetical protein